MSFLNKISYIPKIGKVVIVVGLCLSSLLMVGYFYLKANARELFLEFANEKTQGKYYVNLKHVQINLLDRNVRLKDFTFKEINEDTSESNIEYIRLPELDIQLASLTGLLYKKILIEHVNTTKPEIIYRVKKESHPDSSSMTQTFGKIFLSLESILSELNVNKISISEASLSLRFISDKSVMVEPFTNLNLTISDFNLDNDSTSLLHTSDIHFNTQQLQYTLPDSSTHFNLSSIDISTGEKHIAIKNVNFIHSNPSGTINKFEITIPEIRFRNADFYQLYHYNKIVADSIILLDAQVDLGFKKSFNTAKSSKVDIEKQLIESLHSCDIKYIGLLNSKLNFNTDFQELLNTIQVSKNDIEVWNLTKTPHKIYSLDSILIKVDNYKRYSEDSLYVATLGSVTMNKDKFILNDYHLHPSHELKNKNGIYLESKKLIIHQPDYYSIIVNATANVDDIELYEPKIKYIHNISIHQDKDKRSNKDRVQGIWSRVNLNYLKISNGEISYQSNLKKRKIDFNNVNTRIDFKYISDTISVLSVLHNCQYFNLKKINYEDSKRVVKSGNINYEKDKHYLVFNEFYFQDSIASFDIKNLGFKRLYLSKENVRCEKISWQEATIQIHQHQKQKTPTTSKHKTTPIFHIDTIQGNNARINYSNGETNVAFQGLINTIFSSNVNYETDFNWDHLSLDIQDVLVRTSDVQLKSPKVIIDDTKGSKLLQPILSITTASDQIHSQADSVTIHHLLVDQFINQHELSSDNIQLYQPEITITHKNNNAPSSSSDKKSSNIHLQNIGIINGKLQYKNTIQGQTQNIKLDSIQLKIASIQLDSNDFTSDNIDLNASLKSLVIKDSIFINCKQNIAFNAKKFSRNRENDIELYLNKIFIPVQHIKVLLKDESKVNLSKFDIELKNHHFKFDKHLNIIDFIKSKPDLEIRRVNTTLDTKDGTFHFHNISLSLSNDQLTLDSISYHPKYTLEEFNELYNIQKDYLRMHFGKIALTGIKLHHYIDDQDIFAQKLTLWNASISSTRDKSLDAAPVIEKTLLYGMLKKIPIPIFIQEVKLVNARASYTEFSTNHKSGTMYFDQINGSIKPFTNTTEHADTITLSCTSLLLGKTPLQLHYRESIKDTSSGFKYRLHMGKMDMSYLNPVITPLSNIVIKSGAIDTLIIRSAGNNVLCYGTINFYFRNLKININANSDESIINPLLDIASLYANTLILRTKNTDKIDKVYFERIPHKSIFNYWFKITLSGVMTGIGLRHDKAYQKKYEQYLNSQSIN